MFLKRNRKHTVVSTFILFFIVYAISPISYAGSSTYFNDQHYAIEKEGSHSKYIRILFLNIFFSNLSGEKGKDDANSTLFLFKKIKATLQSPIDPKREQSETALSLDDYTDFHAVVVFNREVRKEATGYYCDDLFLEFSGLSPPLLAHSWSQ